eukprot:scaffold1342_cov255-Chaetoceros_neogracile.AAC.19
MKYLSSSSGMYGVYCARNTIHSAQKSVVKRRVKMYRPNRDNAGQCHSLSFGTMPSGGLLARAISYYLRIVVRKTEIVDLISDRFSFCFKRSLS